MGWFVIVDELYPGPVANYDDGTAFASLSHQIDSGGSEGIREIGLRDPHGAAKQIFLATIVSDGSETVEAAGDPDYAPAQRYTVAVRYDDA